MSDSTKWYVFWAGIFFAYSFLVWWGGYASGQEITNARKVVLDDLGKSLEYQLSIKQMVGEQQ